MKDAMLNAYQVNLSYARELIDDIPDAQMADQPVAGMNHPAWLLGHLVVTGGSMLSLLGADAPCKQAWKDLFAGGTKPLADRFKYPDKGTLYRALGECHDRVTRAFQEAAPEVLDKALEGPMANKFPTVRSLLMFGLTSHEAVHLGQLSAWRRAKGMPPVKI